MTTEATKAPFVASEDGKFIYDNITVERDGTSSYKVYIVWGDDTVYCEVPCVYSLLTFLATLTNKNPLFTSLADHSPANMVKC